MRLIDPPSWSTAMSSGGWPPALAVAWSLRGQLDQRGPGGDVEAEQDDAADLAAAGSGRAGWRSAWCRPSGRRASGRPGGRASASPRSRRVVDVPRRRGAWRRAGLTPRRGDRVRAPDDQECDQQPRRETPDWLARPRLHLDVGRLARAVARRDRGVGRRQRRRDEPATAVEDERDRHRRNRVRTAVVGVLDERLDDVARGERQRIATVPGRRRRSAPSHGHPRAAAWPSSASRQLTVPALVSSTSAIRCPAAPSQAVIRAASEPGSHGPMVGAGVGVGDRGRRRARRRGRRCGRCRRRRGCRRRGWRSAWPWRSVVRRRDGADAAVRTTAAKDARPR